MFTSSSRNSPAMNADGTRNIYCIDCGRFISKSYVSFSRAQCELCRRALNGETITAEMIRQYDVSKMGQTGVSMVVLPTEDMPQVARKFSWRSLGSDIVHALGLPKRDEAQVAALPSVKTSKSRSRGRLFENLDLGNIEEVDKQLKDSKK